MNRVLFPWSVTLVALSCFEAGSNAADDILIADFEGPTYAGWAATGDAFGDRPSGGAVGLQKKVSGFLGDGLANDRFKPCAHGRFNHGRVAPGGVHAPSAASDVRGGVINDSPNQS